MVQNKSGKKVKTLIIWAALSLTVLLNGSGMFTGIMSANPPAVTVADGGGRPPGGG